MAVIRFASASARFAAATAVTRGPSSAKPFREKVDAGTPIYLG